MRQYIKNIVIRELVKKTKGSTSFTTKKTKQTKNKNKKVGSRLILVIRMLQLNENRIRKNYLVTPRKSVTLWPPLPPSHSLLNEAGIVVLHHTIYRIHVDCKLSRQLHLIVSEQNGNGTTHDASPFEHLSPLSLLSAIWFRPWTWNNRLLTFVK